MYDRYQQLQKDIAGSPGIDRRTSYLGLRCSTLGLLSAHLGIYIFWSQCASAQPVHQARDFIHLANKVLCIFFRRGRHVSAINSRKRAGR